MKKIFLLSLILVFSAVTANADEITVVAGDVSIADNQDIYIGIWDTDTGQVTRVKDLDWSNGFGPSLSAADPATGKIFTFNSCCDQFKTQIYDANTNTNISVPEPEVDIFKVLPTVIPKGVDGVISLTNDDAEIKIDETNNTVNIDNAALSDGDGTNMITLEDDGSVSLGGDDMIVIDDEGISIDGKQLIAEKEDGAIHIGENSLITVEQDGVQKLYAEDENGDAIDIDITNGSDLLINGVSVIDRLNANNRTYIDSIANNLADGIEDSNAMSAALAALPNTAPDAEAYCGGGIGSYGDAQAFSLGCASNINDNFAVNFGASKLSSSGASIGNRDFDDYSLKAGFIYKIGYKPSKSSKSNTAALETELYKQQASLRAIAEKEDYKDTKIAEYEKRLAKLEDQLEELKVAMLAGNKEFASLAK